MAEILRYTGKNADSVTGAYPLGNGYRVFLPGCMRFASPDDWSRFGPAGLNPYAYCAADPINRSDPDGHMDLPAFTQETVERSLAEEDGAFGAGQAAGQGAVEPSHDDGARIFTRKRVPRRGLRGQRETVAPMEEPPAELSAGEPIQALPGSPPVAPTPRKETDTPRAFALGQDAHGGEIPEDRAISARSAQTGEAGSPTGGGEKSLIKRHGRNRAVLAGNGQLVATGAPGSHGSTLMFGEPGIMGGEANPERVPPRQTLWRLGPVERALIRRYRRQFGDS